MTLLHEAVEAKKFDVRLIERNVARNVLTAAEAEKAAKSLPDDAEAGEWVSIESIAGETSSANQS
jgi:hypothetical protein